MIAMDTIVQVEANSYTLVANKAAAAEEAAGQSEQFAYQTVARNVGQADEYREQGGPKLHRSLDYSLMPISSLITS
jgi:hypothetical protein